MKYFNFDVNASISVKVELIQLVSNSELVALRFSRTEEIFGIKELVSVKHVAVSNEEVYSTKLESLAIKAFGTNSKIYATFLVAGKNENANEHYYKLMEIQELLHALKTRPNLRLRNMEVTK